MTGFRVRVDAEDLDDVRGALQSLIEDGLVRLDQQTLVVCDEGRPFLRNAATAFDAYFERTANTYSSAV